MAEIKKAMIVDDDPNISELLRLYFDKDGFAVITCLDGDRAFDTFVQSRPDVVILDLMLPGKDGYDVLREIRRVSEVPVIMLTARGDTLDKVVGLELGADDYVQKPFEPKELLARVKAVLRRTDGSMEVKQTNSNDESKDAVSHPGLIVDRSRYSVRVNQHEIEMPPKELELLFFLASHPNRVFTREQLLENSGASIFTVNQELSTFILSVFAKNSTMRVIILLGRLKLSGVWAISLRPRAEVNTYEENPFGTFFVCQDYNAPVSIDIGCIYYSGCCLLWYSQCNIAAPAG